MSAHNPDFKKGCEHMTEKEFDAQIQGNYASIASLQSEIAQLEEQVNELFQVKSGVVDLQNKLRDTGGGVAKAMHMMQEAVGVVSSMINGNFFGRLAQLAQGSEYIAATQNMLEAQDVVQRKIQELKEAIEQKKASISNCSRAIENLQTSKAQYVEEQARLEAEAGMPEQV